VLWNTAFTVNEHPGRCGVQFASTGDDQQGRAGSGISRAGVRPGRAGFTGRHRQRSAASCASPCSRVSPVIWASRRPRRPPCCAWAAAPGCSLMPSAEPCCCATGDARAFRRGWRRAWAGCGGPQALLGIGEGDALTATIRIGDQGRQAPEGGALNAVVGGGAALAAATGQGAGRPGRTMAHAARGGLDSPDRRLRWGTGRQPV